MSKRPPVTLNGDITFFNLWDAVNTELVFIAKPGQLTNQSIQASFDQVAVESQNGQGYRVKDLRSFNVVFA